MNSGHKDYLTKLCKDAEDHMVAMLNKSLNTKEQIAAGNPLFYEVLQHTVFLKEKCQSFHGRDSTLKVSRQHQVAKHAFQIQ